MTRVDLCVEAGYWEALLEDIDGKAEAPPQVISEDLLGELRRLDLPHTDRLAPKARSQDWSCAQRLLDSGEMITLEITGHNRGGLVAQVGHIQAFLPCRHLDKPPPAQPQDERLAALRARVGEPLSVRVVEIDRGRNRLIISERAAKYDVVDGDPLSALRPGQVVLGSVSTICPFGVFVDLGGFDGLIHISELSWNRAAIATELLSPGEEIEVLVLEVRPDQRRVALSLKRLRPDPWLGVEERYLAGQWVAATITDIVHFGAFAQLESGLEGLIHVSELAEGSFMHPANVVHAGELVRARVLHVDGLRRRIALSLRHDGAHPQRSATSLERTGLS